MEKLLIKPAEAAEALALGRTKIYELLAGGIIPSVRVGKSVRIPVEALKTWLNEQQFKASGDTTGKPRGEQEGEI